VIGHATDETKVGIHFATDFTGSITAYGDQSTSTVVIVNTVTLATLATLIPNLPLAKCGPVALSGPLGQIPVYRLVVGCPDGNSNPFSTTKAGQVFTFDLTENGVQYQYPAVVDGGDTSSDKLGTWVSISDDGLTMVTSIPGDVEDADLVKV
jgi:hypothetical protein